MNIRELSNHLESLVIFRAVLDDAVVARLRTALGALEAGEGAVGALADFESALFAHTCDCPRSRLFAPALPGSWTFSRSWGR